MKATETPDFSVAHSPELEAPRTRELDMLLVLLQARRRIVLTTLAGLVVGAVLAFLLPVTYTSIATILPPQAPQSTAAALLGQLGSLGGLSTGGAGSLLKNPTDMYVGILESRTIADHVIDQFHLQSLWKLKTVDATRKALKKHASFEAAKTGLITITVKDPSPQRASDMANAFVDQLYQMNSTLAITEAAQRRAFFDQQLQEEKDALTAAENDLKATEEKTGVIELTGQSQMAIRNIAETRAELANREVELQSMRSYATNQNPDLTRLQTEIDALRQQLARQEDDEKKMPLGDTAVPAGKVPELGLEYARKLREVKYHEAFFSLLAKQYEAARIDEAKSAPLIQVVDRAVPSDHKSGPPRMLIVAALGFLGFCLACFWAFMTQAIARMREYPESAAKLDQVERIFHWRG